jgi:DNA-binding NtrC family response regulator
LATLPPDHLRILFVDDEVSLQEFMRDELPRMGHHVTVCPDGRTALATLEKESFDAAILDLRMPDMTGIQVLERLKQVSPRTEAIMMTGFASVETSVEALKLGAMDYITKPCKLADLQAMLIKIKDRRMLKAENENLKTVIKLSQVPNLLIGDSQAMMAVQRLIATVAPTDATILITGETGTGKEMVARTIYLQSKRSEKTYVPVNCGALSQNLAESELFGHKRGAFTGADKDHTGLLEVANHGTLFLDELGELDKNIQVKLLRYLESGELRRLGETSSVRCDVRVIAATNRNLAKMIEEEEFREDLLYRLNTFEIQLPSLRERKSDIPALARHLLARSAKKPIEQIQELLSMAALDVMYEYDWPGNVREVANAMEYAHIVSGGGMIGIEHLPANVRLRRARMNPMPSSPNSPSILQLPSVAAAQNGNRTLQDIEMEHILKVYEKNNRNKQVTANELGISLKTLYNKLNKWEQDRKSVG